MLMRTRELSSRQDLSSQPNLGCEQLRELPAEVTQLLAQAALVGIARGGLLTGDASRSG